jgi:hypothetical protein
LQQEFATVLQRKWTGADIGITIRQLFALEVTSATDLARILHVMSAIWV